MSFDCRKSRGISDEYVRPQSNLYDYKGDVGASLDAYGVEKPADT